MINIENKLINLAKQIGVKYKITDKSVVFGMDTAEIEREDYEIDKNRIVDSFGNMTLTASIHYYMPDGDDLPDSVCKQFDELLNTGSTTLTFICDVPCDDSDGIGRILIVESQGYLKIFKLDLYDLFSMLGMTDSDMEKELGFIFNDDNILGYDTNKVAEAVDNLTVSDFTYIYIECLLNREEM